MAEEPYTPDDLVEAVNDLATLDFFPKESRASVLAFLARICPHRRALKWLVTEYVDHVGKWHSLAELRGLLCTRFDAKDGIDQPCSLPGYTASEAEMKYLTRHEEIKQLGPGRVSKEIVQNMRQLAQSKAMPPALESKAHRGGSR